MASTDVLNGGSRQGPPKSVVGSRPADVQACNTRTTHVKANTMGELDRR